MGVTPGSLVTPAYDSGWVNITSMAGQNIVLNLITQAAQILSVDIQGKTTATGGIHQKNMGITGYAMAAGAELYGGQRHRCA